MAETAIAKIAEFIRDIVARVEKLEQKQEQFDLSKSAIAKEFKAFSERMKERIGEASVNIDLIPGLCNAGKEMSEKISKLIEKAIKSEKPVFHRGQEVEVYNGALWLKGLYVKSLDSATGNPVHHVVYVDSDERSFWFDDNDVRPKHTTEG